MSRSLLLRLFVVMGLLLGNLALWVPSRATAAIPSNRACGLNENGFECTNVPCNWWCCDEEGNCDD